MQYEGRKEDDGSSIRQANGRGLHNGHALAEVEASAGGDPRRDGNRHLLADTRIIVEYGATESRQKAQTVNEKIGEEKRLGSLTLGTPAQDDFEANKKSLRRRESKTRRAGQKVRKGDKKFLLRVYQGRDGNGKRLYYNETFHGTSKQADDRLLLLQQRRTNDEPMRLTNHTFAEFVEEWLDAVRMRVREDTAEQYKGIVKTYLTPAFGKLRLVDISSERIQKRYTEMRECGLSSATLAISHTLLSNIFDLAIRREKLRRNPMMAIDAPRKEKKEVAAMNADQVRKFLLAAQEQSTGLIFPLAFYTGARSCEYLGFKWADVDWAGKKITVQRSLKWRKGGEWYTSEPKTASSRRPIPLTDVLLKSLTEHRTRQLEQRMKAGPLWQANDFIFTDDIGAPLKAYSVRYIYKKILKRAGLPASFQLRITRHSCATALMSSNTNPKVVSERLGHSSVKVTLDVYSHVAPGLQEHASEQLERLILG